MAIITDDDAITTTIGNAAAFSLIDVGTIDLDDKLESKSGSLGKTQSPTVTLDPTVVPTSASLVTCQPVSDVVTDPVDVAIAT